MDENQSIFINLTKIPYEYFIKRYRLHKQRIFPQLRDHIFQPISVSFTKIVRFFVPREGY